MGKLPFHDNVAMPACLRESYITAQFYLFININSRNMNINIRNIQTEREMTMT